MDRRVVVTGVGLVTPIANTTKPSWEGLLAGKSGVTRQPTWEDECPGLSVLIAGAVEPFDHRPYWRSDGEEKSYDRYIPYAMRATTEAFEMAGLGEGVPENMADRSICIFGVGLAGYLKVLDTYAGLHKVGPESVDPGVLFNISSNMVPAAIARRHGCRQGSFTTVSACTSGAHAVGEAFLRIKHGFADMAITGGCEAGVNPLTTSGFAAMRALSSKHNDSAAAASRPFEKNRSGFVLSEGSGALVLEEYEAAKKRNAPILCEIRGYSATCDAAYLTAPAEEGEGFQRSMRGAIEMAGVRPDEIKYINAHATSTPVGDIIECQAIRHVFGDWTDKGLWVSSTKSMTGHLLGGAGGLEAAISVLSLKEGKVPPTINYDEPDPEIALDVVPGEMREAKMDHALSNSFGFGGTNASIVMSRVEA